MVRASPTGLDADNNPAGGQGGPKVFVVKYAERGNPVSSPGAIRAGATVRHAVGDAELRGWKKRMPFCNGADTGFKVTRPERELRSIWCPAVKPPGEPPQEGKQMTPSQDRRCTFHLRVRGCRLVSAQVGRSRATSYRWLPLGGLSRMTGNCHVRFLEGPGPADGPRPTRCLKK